MITYWVPAYAHPDGWSDAVWFRVVDGWGYRAEQNPAGASVHPCFQVVDGYAYPTLSLPGDAVPTFQVVGSFVYQQAGGGPWFRIVTAHVPRTVS
jgi:hypothetical protein